MVLYFYTFDFDGDRVSAPPGGGAGEDAHVLLAGVVDGHPEVELSLVRGLGPAFRHTEKSDYDSG